MKTLDFSQIIQRSWGYVRQYRALWWLGLLAAFTEKGSMGSFPNPFGSLPGNSGAPTPPSTDDSFGTYLHSLTTDQSAQQAMDWIAQHKAALLEGGALALIALLYLTYVSLASRAGLMKKIQELEDGADDSRVTFKEAYTQGKRHVWRLIGFNFLLGFLIAALFVVTFGISTAGYASYSEHNNYAPVLLILAVLAGLFLLVVILFTVVFQNLTERAIVLKDQKITYAMRSTAKMILNQRANSAWSWLVSVALNVLGGMALGFLVFLAVVVLGLVGLGLYALAHSVTPGLFVVAGIAALALLVYINILTGIYHAFTSAYWTIVYRAMDYIAAN